MGFQEILWLTLVVIVAGFKRLEGEAINGAEGHTPPRTMMPQC